MTLIPLSPDDKEKLLKLRDLLWRNYHNVDTCAPTNLKLTREEWDWLIKLVKENFCTVEIGSGLLTPNPYCAIFDFADEKELFMLHPNHMPAATNTPLHDALLPHLKPNT